MLLFSACQIILKYKGINPFLINSVRQEQELNTQSCVQNYHRMSFYIYLIFDKQQYLINKDNNTWVHPDNSEHNIDKYAHAELKYYLERV